MDRVSSWKVNPILLPLACQNKPWNILLQSYSMLIQMETELFSRKLHKTLSFICPLQINYFQTIILISASDFAWNIFTINPWIKLKLSVST